MLTEAQRQRGKGMDKSLPGSGTSMYKGTELPAHLAYSENWQIAMGRQSIVGKRERQKVKPKA